MLGINSAEGFFFEAFKSIFERNDSIKLKPMTPYVSVKVFVYKSLFYYRTHKTSGIRNEMSIIKLNVSGPVYFWVNLSSLFSYNMVFTFLMQSSSFN